MNKSWTRGSAMAEGLRDVLVSRNSATTKYPYRVALFAWCDNAQTPLNRFFVYMLYKQVCNRHGDKTKRWSLGLSVGGLKRRRCDNQSPSCTHLLIAARRVARSIHCKSTVAQTKMGHMSKTTPLIGVICHPFGEAWCSLPLYKVWEL